MKTLDLNEAQNHYQAICDRGLNLDLTRGKPSASQLDLSNALLGLPGEQFVDDSGLDCRNYGGLDGLDSMKQLFADILGVAANNVTVGGNSSLTMMFEYLSWACLFGVPGGNGPWISEPGRKFLCVVPGYDRHFGITEHLGFELVSVDMGEGGPDMDRVEKLVAMDRSIKGIWCVPKYSNPTGTCYNDQTLQRLAGMQTAAPDFRIIWDNAYAEHHLTDNPPQLGNILEACEAAGHTNRVAEFSSTSKMTFPGAGIAAMASSEENTADYRSHLGVQSIGPDKINQLRHLRLIPDIGVLREHMKKHRAIVKPRFDMVNEVLDHELGDAGVARWTRPDGGYFISLDTAPGLAKRVIELAAQAGVALTSAGAPFPYGNDPDDCNIRIAPTFASLNDVRSATEALSACIILATAEQQ